MKCALRVNLPQEVQHIEDRKRDSCVQDLKSGKHEIFRGGMFGWLLQIFFHVYQTESPQIFQNDCRKMDQMHQKFTLDTVKLVLFNL